MYRCQSATIACTRVSSGARSRTAANAAIRSSMPAWIAAQSPAPYAPVRAWLCAYASVSPQRAFTSSAYCAFIRSISFMSNTSGFGVPRPSSASSSRAIIASSRARCISSSAFCLRIASRASYAGWAMMSRICSSGKPSSLKKRICSSFAIAASS